MKTPQFILITSLCLLFSLLLTAQNDRQWQWAHRAGGIGAGANGEPEEPSDIALDSENNVYVCGHVYAFASFDTLQVNFNLADENIFLAKYNCEGGLAWVKVFGSSRSDFANSLTIDDADNVYITGVIDKGPSQPAILGKDTLNSYGGLYISKFDSEGNNIWNKISYRSGIRGLHIDSGPDGTLYVFGSASASRTTLFSQFEVGGGLYGHYFLMKMDTGGNMHWLKNVSDTSSFKTGFNTEAMSVANNGDVYIGGYLQYDSLYFFSEVIVRKSNGTDIILAKLDSSGQFQWVQRAGGSGLGSVAYAVKVSNNKVFVTGSIYTVNKDVDFGNIIIDEQIGNSSVPFLAQYNSDGSVEWVKVPLNVGNAGGTVVDRSYSDNISWGGIYFSDDLNIDGHIFPDSISASFFVRSNASGDLIEGFQPGDVGSNGRNDPIALAAGYHNNIFYTGRFADRVVMQDIGDTINNDGGGDWDIIVAKYGSSDCSIPEDTLVDTNSVHTPFLHTYRPLSFSPNPVNGNDVNLQLTDPLKEKARARLYSTTGSTVWQGKLAAGNTQISIPGKLPAGHYILELITEHTSYTGKLMVLDGRR